MAVSALCSSGLAASRATFQQRTAAAAAARSVALVPQSAQGSAARPRLAHPQRSSSSSSSASRNSSSVCRGLGSDAVGGWLDVASFLSGSHNKTPYADLAYKIGSDIYVDIAGWKLYFRDLNAAPGVKMADALAHQLGQLVAAEGVREASVASVLSRVPVDLGKGKLKAPLSDLMPAACVADLMRILEDFQRDL